MYVLVTLNKKAQAIYGLVACARLFLKKQPSSYPDENLPDYPGLIPLSVIILLPLEPFRCIVSHIQ